MPAVIEATPLGNDHGNCSGGGGGAAERSHWPEAAEEGGGALEAESSGGEGAGGSDDDGVGGRRKRQRPARPPQRKPPPRSASTLEDLSRAAGGGGEGGAASPPATQQPARAKRRQLEAKEGQPPGGSSPAAELSSPGEAGRRKSTRTVVVVKDIEREAERAKQQAAAAKVVVVKKKKEEERRRTQEEMLIEAAHTEILNLQSLEAMLAREEEVKRKAVVQKAAYMGPLIRALSPEKLPEALRTKVPKAPALAVCFVTGLPARYRDPKTGLPYATIDAFKVLRERAAKGAALRREGSDMPQKKRSGTSKKVRRKLANVGSLSRGAPPSQPVLLAEGPAVALSPSSLSASSLPASSSPSPSPTPPLLQFPTPLLSPLHEAHLLPAKLTPASSSQIPSVRHGPASATAVNPKLMQSPSHVGFQS
eukprot:SM000368S13755  [mRNA]  locus=s368:55619:60050:- [translate_table: standard]